MLRKYIFIIYTFILFVVIIGCQEQVNGKSDNVKYTYHRNGKVESATDYENGVRNGYQKFYDEQGNLLAETIYVNGKKEGVMKAYYPDGSLKFSGKYVNDVLDGEALSFFPDGKIESKKIFDKGRMTYNIRYTPEGKVEFEDKF